MKKLRELAARAGAKMSSGLRDLTTYVGEDLLQHAPEDENLRRIGRIAESLNNGDDRDDALHTPMDS
ncbi:MAG: hypothetical protein GY906_22365 [bacterium]|nr:hypothetical protein [bacterium]